MRASDHIKALVAHSHQRILDYCILNTGTVPSQMLKRYAGENAYRIINDTKNIENMGYRVAEDDFVIFDDLIRHDPVKLARIIMGFIDEG